MGSLSWMSYPCLCGQHPPRPGSEYLCVVAPVITSAWLMLQRNLLYTAVTRAKRIMVLVGSKRALAKAVRTRRRPPPHRPHRTAPAGASEDRCGSQPTLGRQLQQVRSSPRADPRSGRAAEGTKRRQRPYLAQRLVDRIP